MRVFIVWIGLTLLVNLPMQGGVWTSSSRTNQNRGFSASTIVSSGGNHTIAINQGKVYSWGLNTYGQLGTQDNVSYISPQLARGTDGEYGMVAVSAGRNHSMALSVNGWVFCWGLNSDGQLGDGFFTNRNLPWWVSTLTNVVAISAGANHSLALKVDGTVWAWGDNSYGQLGSGTLDANKPKIVPGLDSIVAISAGAYHNLALRVDGSVWAWGANFDGQLGDGTTTNQLAPVKISTVLINNMVSISGGDSTSYAVRADGKLFAWGSNESGQLGNGSLTNRSTPDSVATMFNVESIDAGGKHILVRKANGTIWTWGGNTSGQLGDATLVNKTNPFQISSIALGIAVNCGSEQSFVIQPDGVIKSFGKNNYGQLGDSTIVLKSTPTTIKHKLKGVIMVAAGGNHTLALETDGTMKSWGDNFFGQLGNGADTVRNPCSGDVAVLSNIISIAAGHEHSIVLKADGTVWTWGKNLQGQLGNGSTSSAAFVTPTQVSGLSNIVYINAGYSMSYAISADGYVYSWGNNLNGSVGDGKVSFPSRNTPYKVTAITNMTGVRGGFDHSLVVNASGRVYAFGANNYGQIGDGTTSERSTPKLVASLYGILDVASGYFHSVSLSVNGNVHGWGQSDNGNFGDCALSTPKSLVPTLSNISSAKYIAAYNFFSKFILADGTVVGAGYNNSGVLGDNTVSNRFCGVPSYLEEVEDDGSFSAFVDGISVSAGNGHAGALRDSWTIATVGKNNFGQLGNCTGVEEWVYQDQSDINCINPPTSAIAGSDLQVCTLPSSPVLSGNIPTAGVPRWRVIEGSSTLLNSTASSTSISGLSSGSNKYIYSILSAGCPASRDTVVVMVNDQKANAGANASICVGSTYQLIANTPKAGSGIWSGLDGGTIAAPTNDTTLVSGLAGGINYRYIWSMTEGTCSTTKDTMTLSVKANPTVANVTSQDTTVCEQTNISIKANTPTIGSGSWNVASGLASIATPSLSTTSATGMSVGNNYFVWTISNAPCVASKDTLKVVAENNPLTPDAGDDQTICETEPFVVMSANSPGIYTAVWSVAQGSANFSNPSTSNSFVDGYTPNVVNKYVWTHYNVVCRRSDTVNITVLGLPTTANAGPDDVVCHYAALNYPLQGNDPTSGTGHWTSPTSGTIFNDDSSATSTVKFDPNKLIKLVWTISNGICGSNSDTVLIESKAGPGIAYAGSDQTTCDASFTMNATPAENGGYGTWFTTDTCGFVALVDSHLVNATLTSLCYGKNTFIWKVTNGGDCQSADTINIFRETSNIVLNQDLGNRENLYVLGADVDKTINWYKDSTLIPGANSADYFMVENCGYYYVEAYDEASNCFTRSNADSFCINGIEENNLLNQTNIYPNPTNAILNIEFEKQLSSRFNVALYNAVGALVLSQEVVGYNFSIDMSTYNEGIYLLQLKNGDYQTVRKIIKQ